jgi:hypothetical protein
VYYFYIFGSGGGRWGFKEKYKFKFFLLTLWFLKEERSDNPKFGCKVNKL